MKIMLKTLWCLATALVLLAFSLVVHDFINTRQKFPTQTFISGVDVSLLNREEAIAKLERFSSSQLFSPLVVFEVDGARYSFPPNKIGIKIAARKSVNYAFKHTHNKNYLDDLQDRLSVDETHSPLLLHLEKKQMKAVLEALADEIYAPSKEATFKFSEKTRFYKISSEKIGRHLDITKNLKRIERGVSKKENYFSMVVSYASPEVTAKALRAAPPIHLLSSYKTYYGKHDSANRIHNIKLIANWLNDKLIMPGKVFSASEILGEVTEDKGYKEAFVIIQGELVPHLGGGACQIATTLFNAISLADFKILERRNHSFYFNIYPLGRDAAIYPGQIDFRFENDTPQPILIKAQATNRKLAIKIYGTPIKKKVKFSKPKIYGKAESGKFVPMSLKEIIEQDIPFRTEIERTVYKLGKRIKQETVRSYYKLYGDKENVPIRRPESG